MRIFGYRLDINVMILDLLGGIRSTCTYVGASKLKELSKRTTFVRVTITTNEIYTAHEKDWNKFNKSMDFPRICSNA